VTNEAHPIRRKTRPILIATGGALLAAGALVLAGGGVSLALGGLSIRVHSPWRLLIAGLGASAIAVALGPVAGVKADLERAWNARGAWASWMAGAAAVVTLVAGLRLGTWTAGSADSYGYVSQAFLWLKGSTIQAQPLADRAPWAEADWSLSPLGYRPAPVRGSIVPTYPPGLPLAMAGAAAIAGPRSVFWIVPLLGAAAVWLTYLLGRREIDAVCGAVAAVLLAASPVFLFQLVQPMSDVPVTAWWVASLLAVASGRPSLAGTCAGAALLTRPNLAPLAAWALVGVIGRRRTSGTKATGLRHAALFAAPVVAALGFLGFLNSHWYGHPLASGYGTAGELFATAYIPVNFDRYVSWMLDTQTPLVLLGLAAPALAWLDLSRPRGMTTGTAGTAGAPAATSDVMRPGAAWFGLGFAALVLAAYLPYSPFTEWSYLRFLLPGLPVLLILSAAVLLRPIGLLPASARVPTVILAVSLLAGRYVSTAAGRDAFNLQRIESRYQDAGAYAATSLPSTAILLSVQESGPLRHYGGRTTLRFDHLDPQELDSTVNYLERAGYRPYFALEAWEEAQFRDRFGRATVLGQLDWPPAAEIGSPVKVRFYDPRDRERYFAGDHVPTVRAGPDSGAAALRRTAPRR
jgi:hypothetical protein